MHTAGFAKWTRRFEDERERRRALGDPQWERSATLHPAVWASIQRFQVGEDGDGANLVGKADQAGDPDDGQAVRLFLWVLRGYSGVDAGEETDSCGAGQAAGFRRQGERPCADPRV
jgi:hypothetical protein